MKLFSLCLSWAFIFQTEALFFHLMRNEKKCFIEEMPEETIFQGHYSVKISKPNSMHEFVPTPSGFGMHVAVTNPDGREVLSRSYGSEGKFSFTSDLPGEYLVCMGSNITSSFNILKTNQQRLRVNFKIKVGEHSTNYQEMAQKEELTEMQLHLRRMLEQTQGIAREQNFQRYRENKFRASSEDISSKVLKWAVVQLVVLIVLGMYSMRHLKNFFQAKKLV